VIARLRLFVPPLVIVVGLAALWKTPERYAPSTDAPGRAVAILPSPHIPFVAADHPAYNSVPPTSGPHVPQTVAPGVYTQPLAEEIQVHVLEHGHVLIQYGAELPPAQLSELRTVARRHPRDVVLAPYPPVGRGVALTSWGRVARLTTADERQIEAFIDAFAGRYVHGRTG
jgi:hypothetical protein